MQGTSAPRRHEYDLRRFGSAQLQTVDISAFFDIRDFRCTRLYIGCMYNKIGLCVEHMCARSGVASSDWAYIGRCDDVGGRTDC